MFILPKYPLEHFLCRLWHLWLQCHFVFYSGHIVYWEVVFKKQNQNDCTQQHYKKGLRLPIKDITTCKRLGNWLAPETPRWHHRCLWLELQQAIISSPLLPELIHFQLEALNLVAKFLFEETIGFLGRQSVSLWHSESGFEPHEWVIKK